MATWTHQGTASASLVYSPGSPPVNREATIATPGGLATGDVILVSCSAGLTISRDYLDSISASTAGSNSVGLSIIEGPATSLTGFLSAGNNKGSVRREVWYRPPPPDTSEVVDNVIQFRVCQTRLYRVESAWDANITFDMNVTLYDSGGSAITVPSMADMCGTYGGYEWLIQYSYWRPSTAFDAVMPIDFVEGQHNFEDDGGWSMAGLTGLGEHYTISIFEWTGADAASPPVTAILPSASTLGDVNAAWSGDAMLPTYYGWEKSVGGQGWSLVAPVERTLGHVDFTYSPTGVIGWPRADWSPWRYFIFGWFGYDYDDPPAPITGTAPRKCQLHIPHKRWMDSKDVRLAEENWHAVEEWVRRYLSDDGCRPCGGSTPHPPGET